MRSLFFFLAAVMFLGLCYKCYDLSTIQTAQEVTIANLQKELDAARAQIVRLNGLRPGVQTSGHAPGKPANQGAPAGDKDWFQQRVNETNSLDAKKGR